MADTSFSWQLVEGDIRVRCKLGNDKLDNTWSSEPPRCEYVAEPGEGVRKIYFYAGKSIDMVKALLNEIAAELEVDLLQSLLERLEKRPHEEDEEPSQKRQHAVMRALLQSLSPPTFPPLTVVCIDQSYWRSPGFIADPKDAPCPNVIAMSMSKRPSFTPKDLLWNALPDATETQVNDIYKRYEKQWTEMDRRQQQEMMDGLKELAKSPADFRTIPLEADDNEGKSDKDLSRDRELWVMKHGPVPPKVLYEVVSRLAPQKSSANSWVFPTSILSDMGAGILERIWRRTFASCLGLSREDDEGDPASAASLNEKQQLGVVSHNMLRCAM